MQSTGGPISWSSSLLPSVGGNNNDGDILFERYVSILSDQEIINKVNNLAQAVMPIGEQIGQFTGNCVVIAEDLVLTSRHCVENKVGFISKSEGRVVFDGFPENSDFKILYFKNLRANPIKLDVVPNCGDSIQMYFKVDESSQLKLYVKRFESESGQYAKRSDFAFSKTKPGESGAPRMSMINGYVHAIHQGESEGLKINDIYDLLDRVSKNASDHQCLNAASILKRVHFENLEMKGMYWSSVALAIGDVEEEKPRVQGTITVTVQIGKKWIESTFKYLEVGERRGPRAIRINEEGVEDSLIQYNIDPNPHANKQYNNGGQKSFYRVLAKSVGENYLENSKIYPGPGTIEVFGEVYTLSKAEIV